MTWQKWIYWLNGSLFFTLFIPSLFYLALSIRSPVFWTEKLNQTIDFLFQHAPKQFSSKTKYLKCAESRLEFIWKIRGACFSLLSALFIIPPANSPIQTYILTFSATLTNLCVGIFVTVIRKAINKYDCITFYTYITFSLLLLLLGLCSKYIHEVVLRLALFIFAKLKVQGVLENCKNSTVNITVINI